MFSILREIDTPDKTYELICYDLVLKPVNILLGKRKVVHIGNKWPKEERTTNVALLVLACLAALALAPLIPCAFLLKACSEKHRQMSKSYHYERKEAFFRDRGYIIRDINRREKESFSFHLEKKYQANDDPTGTFWVEFTWNGKLKHKKLFEQAI